MLLDHLPPVYPRSKRKPKDYTEKKTKARKVARGSRRRNRATR